MINALCDLTVKRKLRTLWRTTMRAEATCQATLLVGLNDAPSMTVLQYTNVFEGFHCHNQRGDNLRFSKVES